MGKKRIITESGVDKSAEAISKAAGTSAKRKLTAGVLNIEATYNNTKINLADGEGRVIAWSSSGTLGFKGAKKGTPFAAGKVAELLAEKAQVMGLKEIDIVVRGVGSGRESAIRAFVNRGFAVNSLKDATPIPFNGPKPRKPRRV